MEFVACARTVDAFSDTVAVVRTGTDVAKGTSPSRYAGTSIFGALTVASAILWADRCFAPFSGVTIMARTYLGILVAKSVVGANSVTMAGLLGAASAGEPILTFADGVSVHLHTLSVVVARVFADTELARGTAKHFFAFAFPVNAYTFTRAFNPIVVANGTR